MGKSDNIKDLNLIGTGTTVEGKIKSQGSIRIDGKIQGEVFANENIFVGESGDIDGAIQARSITIGGKVQGTVTATEKLVLETKSKVHGEIKAAKLVIDEGAFFDGKCTMADGKQQSQQKPAQKP